MEDKFKVGNILVNKYDDGKLLILEDKRGTYGGYSETYGIKIRFLTQKYDDMVTYESALEEWYVCKYMNSPLWKAVNGKLKWKK